MRKTPAIALLIGLVLLGLVAIACSQSNTARAELKDADGRAVGEATLVAARDSGGVTVTLDVRSLPPGTHGVHIHDVCRPDPPAFASAGGHYNPGGKQHGLQSPGGPHNDDLPNLNRSSRRCRYAERSPPPVTEPAGGREHVRR